MRCQRTPLRGFAATLLVVLILSATAAAQLPTSQFSGLFPAGAAPGSTLEVTITGSNLDETDKLLFSHEGIKATGKMADPTPWDEGPQRVENVFNVAIAENVPPGRYEVRAHGKYGLSNPRTFMIGSLPEFIEVEPNGGGELPAWSEVDDGNGGKRTENPATELTLPATVSGQSTGGADVDWYRFQGTAGGRVLLEGFAKRIDSRMEMMITLFAADAAVIGEARTGSCGDPLIDATLPAAGEYFVKVHDALYRNGAGYHYRLRIGSLPHLDFVFPPAGQPGSNEQYTVYGCNLPGGAKSDVSIDGYALETSQVRIAIPADVTDKLQFASLLGPHQGGMDGIEYRLENGNTTSNPLLVTAATAPIVLEQTENNRPETAQKLTPPCEVAGQFYPQRDVDWFSFEAKKDEVWAFDLYSQRLGSSTDPSLLIQRVSVNDAGEEQISDVQFIDDVQEQNFNNQSGRHEFDFRTTDPYYLLTAPADGTYRLLVRDGHSSVKSDPRLVYRLAIRKPAPDYRLVAVPGISSGSLLLRRGGRQVVRIFVFRRDGYDGEIRVSCAGLPQGVTSEEITIGPGNTMGTLILTTAADASPAVSSLQVTSKGIVDGKEVVRNARYGAAIETFQFNQPNARVPSVPSRIVDGIQLCVTDYDPAPVMLTIGQGKPLETSRGGKLKIPYEVKRVQGATGNINAFPIDFPPQTAAPQVSIGANKKGEFELSFRSNTPTGTYTCYLAGFNQGYSYKRNPELAERAKQRQERIAGILAEATKKTQQAQQSVNQKQTELQGATNTLNQAKRNTQQADQAVAAADSAMKTAAAALKQKQDAAAANAEDESLKTQANDAQTAVDAAAKKLEEAKAAAADALKKQQEAEAAMNAAQTAKSQADMDLQAAREFQQKTQQEKQRADQFANQKKNESNPRNININVPSNSLTIKITEFPIEVETLAAELTLKQGEKIEVPIKLSRLYDFKANVNLNTQLPGGVGGIGLQSINIPADKPEGKFEINAQANATVGVHECKVRLQMNFNGQNLTMERPLKLTVVEVKAEK